MKKLLLSALLLSLTGFSLLAQTAEEIVAKHIESRGGAEKLRAVHSIVMQNTMEAREMEFDNSMRILVGKAMRTDTKIMGNAMVQAFDGSMAWAIRPSMMGGTGEPEPMPAEMSKGVKRQTDPFPLLDYTTKGGTLTLVGAEKVKDQDCVHVKMTYTDGDPVDFWLRTADGLVAKLKVNSPMGAQELLYSNHKIVEGISFPHNMETENQMASSMKMTTQKIILNSKLTEADFKMPAK
jgi:hypothetical protein